MITRKMDGKFDEFKNYFNEKMSSQKQSLKFTINALIHDLKSEITKEIKREVSKQDEKLFTQNKMLQQSMSKLRKLNLDNQADNEELEQYGRRFCLRIGGILLKNNEISEDVLDSVKNLFELAKVNIPNMVVDRVHRIGRIYNDRA